MNFSKKSLVKSQFYLHLVRGYLATIYTICCLLPFQTFAQSIQYDQNLFSLIEQDSFSKLSSQSIKKISKIDSLHSHKKLLKVKVGNFAKIQNNGRLKFSIPGYNDIFTYEANKVNAESEMDFTWYGLSPDSTSSAIFICKDGKLSGSFNYNQKYFQLYTLDNDVSILQEDKADVEVMCGTMGEAPSANPKIEGVDNKQSISPDAARMGVCTEPVRVLVLYTQNAAGATVNINQIINLSIQQFNQTIDNSGNAIPQTNKILLAGSQLVAFTSNNPESTANIDQATTWVRDNATVQNLRNQYNADLVVCLVNATYSSNYVGWAANIPASNTDYCAVVKITASAATNQYAFTHELGHLFGGRHEVTNDAGPPAYSHGHQFTGNNSAQYRTMMHANGNITRILHFSNPNVSYMGTPTGTTSTSNVARVMGENSVNIVNFRPSVTQPFNATIIGPTSITTQGWYNWELYFFCKPLGSTTWQFSTDGFNYGSAVGFGDAVNNYNISASNNGTLFLRCTINNGGQIYVATTTINVNICSGCRFGVKEEPTLSELQSTFSSIFPNPSQDKITLSYSSKKGSVIQLELVDMLGKRHMKEDFINAVNGEHQHDVNVKGLQSGLYLCRLNIGQNVFVKPFVVVK